MKSILKSFAFGCALLGGVLALSACGDDVTKVYQTTEENSGMEIAKSADDFGDCDSASIGKMMFASDENAAYICADSGWTPLSEKASDGKDGASCSAEPLSDNSGYKIMCGEDSVGVILNGETGTAGKDGTSCSAEPLSDNSGYKIMCGEDSVGVILNGEAVAAGKDGTSCSAEPLSDNSGYKIMCGEDSVGVILNGEAGAAGKDGASCSVEMLTDGTGYKVVCGEDSVGVILNGSDGNGCTLADNGDGTLSQVCGETSVTLYKALCGNVPYEPAKSFCYADSVYALCGGKVFDPSKVFCDARDSAVYGYVQIGTQTWMEENLNYAYPKTSETDSDSLSFCYGNNAANCATYGRLYRWETAKDACPEGWHLPDTTEWNALTKFVADSLYNGVTGNVGYALKSTSGWRDNGNGSDAFGFGALPAGYRTISGTFADVQSHANFWSATKVSDNFAYYLSLSYYDMNLRTTNYSTLTARSVRCIKD